MDIYWDGLLNLLIKAIGKSNDAIEIAFNILLVKFNARPSTLIFFPKWKRIINCSELMKFISQDQDIRYDFLGTCGQGNLWIYNKVHKNLFLDENISFKEGEDEIMGARLGYNAAGYSVKVHKGKVDDKVLGNSMWLICDNRLPIQVYGYVSPVSINDIFEAYNRWRTFYSYASSLSYDLKLTFRRRECKKMRLSKRIGHSTFKELNIKCNDNLQNVLLSSWKQLIELGIIKSALAIVLNKSISNVINASIETHEPLFIYNIFPSDDFVIEASCAGLDESFKLIYEQWILMDDLAILSGLDRPTLNFQVCKHLKS